MGCCHSSATESARDADQQQQSRNNATLDGAAAFNNPARENQAIRPPTPLLKSPKNVNRHHPPWTRSIYENELNIFFETRQGGEPRVWQTLIEVARLIRMGNIAEAQTILDAANLSCPNGRIARTRSSTRRGSDGHRQRGGIYDIRGTRYDLPGWVLSEPADLVEEPRAPAPEKVLDEYDNNGTDDDEDLVRPEKGKGRAQDIGEELQVRIRYNDLPRDAVFTIGSKQPVSVLRQKVLDERGIENVKLILTGKIFENAGLQKTLAEVGWNSTMVINAFVTGPPAS